MRITEIMAVVREGGCIIRRQYRGSDTIEWWVQPLGEEPIAVSRTAAIGSALQQMWNNLLMQVDGDTVVFRAKERTWTP